MDFTGRDSREMPRENFLEESQNAYKEADERAWVSLRRRAGADAGVRVSRTCCDGLGPQFIVFELMQISLHEAAGLNNLERHQVIGGTAVGGGRGRETKALRSSRRREALISS